jgi:hypothetical protein
MHRSEEGTNRPPLGLMRTSFFKSPRQGSLPLRTITFVRFSQDSQKLIWLLEKSRFSSLRTNFPGNISKEDSSPIVKPGAAVTIAKSNQLRRQYSTRRNLVMSAYPVVCGVNESVCGCGGVCAWVGMWEKLGGGGACAWVSEWIGLSDIGIDSNISIGSETGN